MLTLPLRIAASIFLALFCASSLVRRAVAGVVVSAFIVAAQHEQAFTTFAAADGNLAGRLIAAFLGG